MRKALQVSWYVIVTAYVLWASGVIPAIVPQAVPTANKRGNATVFQLANNNSAAAAGTSFCDDGSGNATTSGCTGGGTSGGVAPVIYSGPSLTLTGTLFFPPGGGGASSGTESNVNLQIVTGGSVSNFYVQLNAALGIGNSAVFTWRKNGANTALTCTISGASATTCNDTTDSFTVVAADKVDIQAVVTGSIAGVIIGMDTQFASTGSTVTFSSPYLVSGGSNFGPVFAMTPVAGSFSWLNQGGATLTNTNGALSLLAPAGAGVNIRARIVAAPATPYSFTAGIIPNVNAVNFSDCAILFYESGTGKIEENALHVSNDQIENDRYTNTTTYNSTTTAVAQNGLSQVPAPVIWLKIVNDGTNLKFSFSSDNVNFNQYESHVKANFFTTGPDNVGFECNSGNASFPAGMMVLSWVQGTT